MKIRSIEPIAVSLPMKKPVKMAGEEVTRADNMLVRIESDDGVIGWGEAAAAPTMTGETVASMMAAADILAPALLRRPADDIAGASAVMDARMYGNTGAKAAIEMALYDVLGRATSRPLYALLGQKQRTRMPLLAVIGTGNGADADVREAEDKRAAGYVAFKIKVGVDEVDADAERTRRICDALGRGFLISADANQGFSADQAVRYVHAVADTALDFFEQPVRAHDLEGMAQVAAASRVPIGADEGIHSLDDIERHHERKAARGVSLKAIKLGGLHFVRDACMLCERIGFNVNISCKTGESSIASAAAVHLAAVIPSLAWGVTVTNTGLADDVTHSPLKTDRGHVEVIERPGIGIDVDERRVRRYQQEFTARKVA
jgi:muconate cycloisomerase